MIPEWASLLPELVQRIAERVLSTTGGVDAYMEMRAVCPTWRSAISKPSPVQAVADIRFRPRHWLMVDLKSKNHDDDARLFLHVATGRFRRLRLPVLRDHVLVGATTDGLLVLGHREPPHLVRVLNPLTGDMLHFATPYYEHPYEHTAVSGGSHSTLLLWRGTRCMGKFIVGCADPTSNVFTQKAIDSYLVDMVTFQGNVCYANSDGWVFKLVGPAEQFQHELVAQMLPDMDVEKGGDATSRLVESDGELLLVRVGASLAKVFKVDVEHESLQEVKILGCRALFLGNQRCVSVDVDKLPSVDRDCIYTSDWRLSSEPSGIVDCMCVVCMYNQRDGTKTFFTDDHHDQPFSLVQVLLQCCDSCSM